MTDASMRFVILTHEQLGEQAPFARALGPEDGQTFDSEEDANAAGRELAAHVDPALKIEYTVFRLEGVNRTEG